MNIRTKIFLGFSCMFVLILSMCIMSIKYLVNIRNAAYIAVKQTEVAGLSYEIEIALLEARRAEKNYRLNGENSYILNFKERTAEIKEKTTAIKKIDVDKDFFEQIEKIETLVIEYESGFLKIAQKYSEQEQRIIFAGGKGSFVDSARKLQVLVHPILEKAKKQQDRAIRWSNKTKSQAIKTIVFLGLAIIITGILMTYYIPKQVTRSTGRLLDTIKKIEAGEWRARADVKSNDEMEILGDYFNSMLDTLEKTKKKAANAEKLASLGILSAGIAHEINNPLTGILTSAHIVLKGFPKGHESREDVEIIIRETNRCSEIIKGLLDFSRETKVEKTPVDVNNVIEKVISLVKNQVGFRNISVIKNLQQGLPKILADSNKLEQVFLNIIINSQEAMGNSGELVVKSSFEEEVVEVILKDTGCGISEEYIGRVCDPFFTTKEAGKGTGLGLAVSYGIIKEYGGTIEIESKKKAGTVVTMKFNAIEG